MRAGARVFWRTTPRPFNMTKEEEAYVLGLRGIRTTLEDRNASWFAAAGWEPLNFDVVAYRATGTSVVKVSEEVNSLLDDHIVLTQQFSFSPYKGPFEERISQWEAKLRMVQEVISEWLACQV